MISPVIIFNFPPRSGATFVAVGRVVFVGEGASCFFNANALSRKYDCIFVRNNFNGCLARSAGHGLLSERALRQLGGMYAFFMRSTRNTRHCRHPAADASKKCFAAKIQDCPLCFSPWLYRAWRSRHPATRRVFGLFFMRFSSAKRWQGRDLRARRAAVWRQKCLFYAKFPQHEPLSPLCHKRVLKSVLRQEYKTVHYILVMVLPRVAESPPCHATCVWIVLHAFFKRETLARARSPSAPCGSLATKMRVFARSSRTTAQYKIVP